MSSRYSESRQDDRHRDLKMWSLKGTLLVILVLVHSINGNVISQQQANNNSLPGLSERANGLNSRYLSASSTASLAAATVAAAANQTPQNAASTQVSQQQNANANQHNNNQQQQASSHHHQQNSIGAQQLAIQQAHNQLQQQSQPLSNQQQQQVANSPLNQPLSVPQYTPSSNGLLSGGNVVGQSGAFASASATPIMSTTYTFNPQTGQFQPIESSVGSTFPLAGSLPQQNPFLQHQTFASNNQIFGFGSSNPLNYPVIRAPQRFQTPYYQLANGNQQRLASSFNRRNGQLLPQSLGGNQFRQPPIDDDSNGLFQQQPQVAQSLLLDQQFSGNNFDPSTGYQLLASNQLQQIDPQQQSASLGQSVVFPPASVSSPTGTFNSAFQSSQQQTFPINNNDQCVAADGRHGTCYQASECIKRGGTPMGKCGSSIANSRDELPGSSHVCCLFDITCGQFAAERFVYFRNPGYPATFDQKRMCRAKIGKLDKGVCQLRLDMLRFDLAKPTNGNCSSDVFVVSGQNENYVIPKICGFNDGQHYFVGIDESGVITLHMMMMGLYRRSFEILITQIPCRSDYAAPAHCLQYFMGTHGTIKSFNYDDELVQFNNQPPASGVSYDLQTDGSAPTGGQVAPYGLHFSGSNNNQQLQQRQQPLIGAAASGAARYPGGQLDQSFGGYPNDLDYTICIRKESGFCSITYQLSSSEQGLSPFGVGQSFFGNQDNTNSWNQMSTDCRDDYLLIGGVRLCSGASSGVHSGSTFFDPSIHSNSSAANPLFSQQQQQNIAQIQHQLQNQHNALLQQLARIQQQQQGNSSASGTTGLFANGNNNSNVVTAQQQQQLAAGLGQNANLEQQQAALLQQLMSIQQQQQQLLAGGYGSSSASSFAANNGQPVNNRFGNQFDNGQYNSLFGDNNGLHGSIITDTTSGPFLLRFVSNMARNARGFHIDYRQNPCK